MRDISRSASYDTTDAAQPTEDGVRDLNPNQDWRFRTRAPFSPLSTGQFLVAVDIGKVPKDVTAERIQALLARIALPQKGRVPEQNCVTWTRVAILDLQRAGLAMDDLPADKVMRLAFQKADEVMRDGPQGKANDRCIDLDIVRREVAKMPNTA